MYSTCSQKTPCSLVAWYDYVNMTHNNNIYVLMLSCVGGSKVLPRTISRQHTRCECYINFLSAISTSCGSIRWPSSAIFDFQFSTRFLIFVELYFRFSIRFSIFIDLYSRFSILTCILASRFRSTCILASQFSIFELYSRFISVCQLQKVDGAMHMHGITRVLCMVS